MFFGDQHKTITSCYEMLSRKVCEKYQLTQMEYDILILLHNNPRHNTAAEIVKIRKSTKSHVSSSLKNLESRGLVKRVQSTDNKKHIEIVLLEAAIPIIEDGIKVQNEFAKTVLQGLTQEERRLCTEVFFKICKKNLFSWNFCCIIFAGANSRAKRIELDKVRTPKAFG